MFIVLVNQSVMYPGGKFEFFFVLFIVTLSSHIHIVYAAVRLTHIDPGASA